MRVGNPDRNSGHGSEALLPHAAYPAHALAEGNLPRFCVRYDWLTSREVELLDIFKDDDGYMEGSHLHRNMKSSQQKQYVILAGGRPTCCSRTINKTRRTFLEPTRSSYFRGFPSSNQVRKSGVPEQQYL